ncbi:hypothetical protein BN1013_00719 [Candidatus Rubidus massiliensis]|nr:hypothetical protein BN1013_00719 [Candidatus Rubidus massiliensis]
MIETNRLLLRPWKTSDLIPFARMNRDTNVMEYFPSLLSEEESNAFAYQIMQHFDLHGYGFWAVSEKTGCPFIGFIGLRLDTFEAPFTPAVEIGWRLASAYWNKGYGTEGALAALQYGFKQLNLKEIIAFTPTINSRSRKLMEKIGLVHNPKDDFINPKLPEGHVLSQNVLYRIKNPND